MIQSAKARLLALVVMATVSTTTVHAQSNDNTPTNAVKLSSEIDWQQLNPARGDKSPLAGTIWGNRSGYVATGFLSKFPKGFSSPPHIHNITYRAVVINGLIHNGTPKAESMWMPNGSFWTQPVGEGHITSANGEENIAYIEIDKGPYLVKPVKGAYDSGERPMNIHADNVVWLDASQTDWVDADSGAEISFLWESKKNDGLKGLFIKLPKGFNGTLNTDGDIVRGIVVSGELNYTLPQTKETKTLDAGSSFSSTAKAAHTVANSDDVVVYIRTNGAVKVK